ncbi:hypothetical protein [Ensifer adhaerens]
MKADEMSRKYLALQADGAVGKMELNQEIAAALERLPEDPSLYFDLGEAHLLIPLEQLVNARMRERGIISANRYMLASARGKQEKRKPLTVHALGNGLWLVVDGNSTLLNARLSNWRAVPCTTVDKPTWDPSSA